MDTVAGHMASLSSADLEHYRMFGYFVVHDFFSMEDVTALRREVERLQADGHLANLLVRRTADDLHRETAGSTGPVNLQLCPASPVSPLIQALRWHPRLIAAVRTILGDPAWFLLDQIFIKPALSGAGTDWHQDHAYFAGTDPALGVGMWTSLQEATISNGTMRVIPTSHRQAVAHSRDPRSEVLIRAEVDDSREVAIEMSPGAALFFNFGLLHCTRDNTTGYARSAIAMHFVHQGYEPPAHWNQRSRLPDSYAVASAWENCWRDCLRVSRE